MIGIVIAMESETYNFLNLSFDFIEKINLFGKDFYKIKHKNNFFIVCFTGIGKVNASIYTTLMINNFDVNLIINVGSAGIFSNANVGDVVVAKKILYCDVNVTGFGYEIGQIPKMPSYYTSNETIIQKIISKMNNKISYATICTADSFINSDNINDFYIKKNNETILIEMEAASIAQTCFNLKKEFIVFKFGIDKIFEPIKNEEQFNENLLETSKKIDNFLYELINNW